MLVYLFTHKLANHPRNEYGLRPDFRSLPPERFANASIATWKNRPSRVGGSNRKSSIVVKTQRTDLHGRYVTHLFYSHDEVPIATCFREGTYLNGELLDADHAVIAAM